MQSYLGTIQLFSFSMVPRGWAACEGQLLSISQYTALFTLIGTTYGGDGKNTFALPNLQGKAPLPTMNYCICLMGIYPS